MRHTFVKDHRVLGTHSRARLLLVVGIMIAGVVQMPASAVTRSSLRVFNTSVTERMTANVHVVLSGKASRRVTVRYETVNGSAKAGRDYTARSGRISFSKGSRTRTIEIPILGDDIEEGTERSGS